MHQISHAIQSGLHVDLRLLELEGVVWNQELDMLKAKVVVVELVKDFDGDELSVRTSKQCRRKGYHACDVA